MFKAANTDSETQRRKTSVEAQKIRDLYMEVLRTLDIKKFLEFKVQNDQNQPFYTRARSNLMYNYVKRTDVAVLNENKENYDFLDYRYSFFEVVEKNIAAGNFVRARKLLNMAKERGWQCNSMYSLEKEIENRYFGAEFARKRVRSTSDSANFNM